MNRLIAVLMLVFVIGAEAVGFAQWMAPERTTTVSAEETLGALARGNR
ncbi:MAG TPA: hypothetical protein VMH36_14820 [Alphaproteobacteria bacterium]|nr:hypothetical protein [Alphaproteobacteria bacterium]